MFGSLEVRVQGPGRLPGASTACRTQVEAAPHPSIAVQHQRLAAKTGKRRQTNSRGGLSGVKLPNFSTADSDVALFVADGNIVCKNLRERGGLEEALVKQSRDLDEQESDTRGIPWSDELGDLVSPLQSARSPHPSRTTAVDPAGLR